jgi:putative heme iron utilization protein
MDRPADERKATTRAADHAATARCLIRSQDRGALATVDSAGAPHASLVLYATDGDGHPLLLISRLAAHTQNLLADARTALLVDGTAGHAQPLTGPRVTVSGVAAISDDPADRTRFLARHPDAVFYAGFADFATWKLTVESGYLVAGFGAIHVLPGSDLVRPRPAALAEAEPRIVAHMNEDYGDAIVLCANVLLGRAGDGWRMTGIDTEGCDLRRIGTVARLPFDMPVEDGESARKELVRLLRVARDAGRCGNAGPGKPA